ncbi:MAG: hypothetical protein FWG50_05270 [Kiritimatiellaeota bacterium]|nr:hypothetical protein [Kiritimatiellota bacterium]
MDALRARHYFLFWMASLCAAAGCGRAATVEERVAQYGDLAMKRLAPLMAAQALPYPLTKMALIGLKDEKVLELRLAGKDGVYRMVKRYPILAASGTSGPKLREGDLQVPEGFYTVESLNPNSRYHLSLRVGYPNKEDRRHAKEEGRANLGGDIMIHGDAVSVGCIAIGDPAVEEVFVLAHAVGLKNIQVIISPIDFRTRPVSDVPADKPKWLKPLYERIHAALEKFP